MGRDYHGTVRAAALAAALVTASVSAQGGRCGVDTLTGGSTGCVVPSSENLPAWYQSAYGAPLPTRVPLAAPEQTIYAPPGDTIPLPPGRGGATVLGQ